MIHAKINNIIYEFFIINEIYFEKNDITFVRTTSQL